MLTEDPRVLQKAALARASAVKRSSEGNKSAKKE